MRPTGQPGAMEDTHREDRQTHDTTAEQAGESRVHEVAEAVVRLLANPRRVRRP